jgi:ankyrin repeat protein
MLRAFCRGWIVVLLLAGCAQMPGGSADTERLRNAIAIDDVGYLQEAIRSGRVSANQRIPIPGYLEGAPLITIAARYGSLQSLRYLISAGANINARTPAGETALMLASYFSPDDASRSGVNSYEQVVRVLVETGASLENEPHNYTPLAYAAYQGHQRIVRYLIERGARVDGDAEGGVVYVNTPLMMAAIQGHMDTALWLLRAGADPRVRIHLGNTAAELAQKNNHRNILTVLRCAETLAPGEPIVQKCAGR